MPTSAIKSLISRFAISGHVFVGHMSPMIRLLFMLCDEKWPIPSWFTLTVDFMITTNVNHSKLFRARKNITTNHYHLFQMHTLEKCIKIPEQNLTTWFLFYRIYGMDK